jgi:hypothetical protein
VNDITLLRIQNPRVTSRTWFVAALFFVGCRPAGLSIHYLPGFVPATRNIFAPKTVAVAVAALGTDEHMNVGAVRDQNGRVLRELWVSNPDRVIQHALVIALGDAGLKVSPLDAPPVTMRPQDTDVLLIAHLEKIAVNKTFRGEKTVHGQYFKMKSEVRLAARLFDSNGRLIYDGEVTATEDEPPAPVAGEVFLPLETDPAESLSVALSRAAGYLILELAKRNVFPSAK